MNYRISVMVDDQSIMEAAVGEAIGGFLGVYVMIN